MPNYKEAFCSKCKWDRQTHIDNPEDCKLHDWQNYDGHEFDGEKHLQTARGATVFNEYAARWESGETEPQTVLGDLLADLMHLCERHDLDFDMAWMSAELNYRAERGKGDDIEQATRAEDVQ